MNVRLLAAAACSLLMTFSAQAAEVRLLAAGALKEIFLELAPQFVTSSGDKVTATSVSSR